MKKSLSFFMMLVLVIGMLAACGPQREAQPEKTDKDNGTGETRLKSRNRKN